MSSCHDYKARLIAYLDDHKFLVCSVITASVRAKKPLRPVLDRVAGKTGSEPERSCAFFGGRRMPDLVQ